MDFLPVKMTVDHKVHLHWKNFFFKSIWCTRLLIAVHENVATGRVTVEVAEEEYLSRFLCLLHHKLCVIVDWVELGAGADPLAVQVLAHEWTAIVADDDAIRIQHWYYFEDERIPQILRLGIIANEEVYATLHHVRSIWLTWVYTRC